MVAEIPRTSKYFNISLVQNRGLFECHYVPTLIQLVILSVLLRACESSSFDLQTHRAWRKALPGNYWDTVGIIFCWKANLKTVFSSTNNLLHCLAWHSGTRLNSPEPWSCVIGGHLKANSQNHILIHRRGQGSLSEYPRCCWCRWNHPTQKIPLLGNYSKD